jgi:hypothetical protein
MERPSREGNTPGQNNHGFDSFSRNDEIVFLTREGVYRMSLWPVNMPESAAVKETVGMIEENLWKRAPLHAFDGYVQSVRRAQCGDAIHRRRKDGRAADD